jgi:Transposase DDE domain
MSPPSGSGSARRHPIYGTRPRPKVERKLGHLMRRRHGGRRARVRGSTKIAADFALLAAAVNLARLGVLAVARTSGGSWAVALR